MPKLRREKKKELNFSLDNCFIGNITFELGKIHGNLVLGKESYVASASRDMFNDLTNRLVWLDHAVHVRK